MKVSDAEVIKALECCINCDCKNCPCKVDESHCDEIPIEEILDLINRLKAENKNCGVKIQNQREQLKACNEKIKKQQAEIEGLKAFKSYFDELSGQDLEVANWHLNGSLEPFDSFYKSALEEMG